MTTYKVEFPGVGYAKFGMLPGGQFEISTESGIINVYIEDSAPAGINAA